MCNVEHATLPECERVIRLWSNSRNGIRGFENTGREATATYAKVAAFRSLTRDKIAETKT